MTQASYVPASQRYSTSWVTLSLFYKPFCPVRTVIAIIITEKELYIFSAVALCCCKYLCGGSIIHIYTLDMDATRHLWQRSIPIGEALVTSRQVKFNAINTLLSN
ncbi:MAG: hypothetical protein DCO81_06515 [Candidatus Aquiluna sp. XM-24bin5]|nr:MAG: hypothetical protein DCO81_06515 [Candidatus Aquiluna sp. XM-24bin5]